jgi:hypothetical protein
MTMPSASRYELVQHGELLTGRAMGSEVALDVATRVHQGETLLLSFAGVEVASFPFVDELLGVLQERLAHNPESMLVVHGLNTSVREHVVSVLDARGMVLASLSRRGITLLGASGDLRKLMRAVQELDVEFSADELARRLPRRSELVEQGVRRLIAAGALSGRPSTVDRSAARSDRRLRRPPADRLLQLTS